MSWPLLSFKQKLTFTLNPSCFHFFFWVGYVERMVGLDLIIMSMLWNIELFGLLCWVHIKSNENLTFRFNVKFNVYITCQVKCHIIDDAT
jgi:hypothetical protein